MRRSGRWRRLRLSSYVIIFVLLPFRNALTWFTTPFLIGIVSVLSTAKALELFLGLIVEEASKVTIERGAKKVEAYHLYVLISSAVLLVTHSSFTSRHSGLSIVLSFFLRPSFFHHTLRKHAVETTEMLDFLREIVETVPDPSAGGTIDLEAESAENAAKKKKGKARKAATPKEKDPNAPPRKRRKKKQDDEEAEAEADAEMKSEPEHTDGAMDEDEDEEHDTGRRNGRDAKDEQDDDDEWDGDRPFMPGPGRARAKPDASDASYSGS